MPLRNLIKIHIFQYIKENSRTFMRTTLNRMLASCSGFVRVGAHIHHPGKKTEHQKKSRPEAAKDTTQQIAQISNHHLKFFR